MQRSQRLIKQRPKLILSVTFRQCFIASELADHQIDRERRFGSRCVVLNPLFHLRGDAEPTHRRSMAISTVEGKLFARTFLGVSIRF